LPHENKAYFANKMQKGGFTEQFILFGPNPPILACKEVEMMKFSIILFILIIPSL
jgi:hypothetical protein